MKMKQMSLATIFAVLMMPFGSVLADGAALAKEQCANCQGDTGNSSDPKVPNIAGFSVTTFMDMAETYRDGSRQADKYTPKTGDATDMNAVMKATSDADLQAIAQFYAGQKFKRHAQKTDPAKVAKGAEIHDKSCEKCHSENGSLADDDAGILAGQWKPYLQAQFGKFSSGKRAMPKKMKKKFDPLTAEEKAALLDFYASQK